MNKKNKQALLIVIMLGIAILYLQQSTQKLELLSINYTTKETLQRGYENELIVILNNKASTDIKDVVVAIKEYPDSFLPTTSLQSIPSITSGANTTIKFPFRITYSHPLNQNLTLTIFVYAPNIPTLTKNTSLEVK